MSARLKTAERRSPPLLALRGLGLGTNGQATSDRATQVPTEPPPGHVGRRGRRGPRAGLKRGLGWGSGASAHSSQGPPLSCKSPLPPASPHQPGPSPPLHPAPLSQAPCCTQEQGQVEWSERPLPVSPRREWRPSALPGAGRAGGKGLYHCSASPGPSCTERRENMVQPQPGWKQSEVKLSWELPMAGKAGWIQL